MPKGRPCPCFVAEYTIGTAQTELRQRIISGEEGGAAQARQRDRRQTIFERQEAEQPVGRNGEWR